LQLKEAAVAILQLDGLIQRVIVNLREFGKQLLQKKREKEELKR
jgi:hypothetical protein